MNTNVCDTVRMAPRCPLAIIASGILVVTMAAESQMGSAQPPSHPVFDDFEFIQVLPDHKRGDSTGFVDGQGTVLLRRLLPTLRAFRPTVQDLSSWQFPNQLKGDYTPMEELGEGSFGVAYLAVIRSTQQKVVVKLLKNSGTGSWITAADMHDPSTKSLARESERECDNAKAIHKNKVHDTEGDKHVTVCITDGIKKAMEDPLRDMPLFIVMTYDGPVNLGKYWAERVLPVARAVHDARAIKEFRRLTKQLMEGLRFMSESGDVGYVHHDLKTPNIVVNPGASDELLGELTIIDLGTALSTERPKDRSACTVAMRPPEVSWGHPVVGFNMPVHSFDTWSAAMTIAGMAAAAESDGEFFLPGAFELAYSKLECQVRDHVDIARCLAQAKDTTIEDGGLACTNTVLAAGLKRNMNKHLDMVRNSKGSRRQKELARLLACKVDESGVLAFRGNLPMLDSVVHEWINTGFDNVLLKMFSANPEGRPKPSKILESSWLQDGDLPSSSPPKLQYSCEDLQSSPIAKFEILGHALIILFCIGSCCCGGFMSLVWKLPPILWSGPSIAALLLSTGVGAGSWLSRSHLLRYMLGIPPAIGIICSLAVRLWTSRKEVWPIALGVALVIFTSCLVVIVVVTSPVRSEYHKIRTEELDGLRQMGLILAKVSFVPPLMGICLSLSGLWSAKKAWNSEGSARGNSSEVQMGAIARVGS